MIFFIFLQHKTLEFCKVYTCFLFLFNLMIDIFVYTYTFWHCSCITSSISIFSADLASCCFLCCYHKFFLMLFSLIYVLSSIFIVFIFLCVYQVFKCSISLAYPKIWFNMVRYWWRKSQFGLFIQSIKAYPLAFLISTKIIEQKLLIQE